MIDANPWLQESYKLGKYCHSYMHFNNNLNGTYRHFAFERTVVNLLINDMQTGISALLPSVFAKSASFIISYGHTNRDKKMFPEFIVQKVEAMEEQFTITDCYHLTRGIQIALEMR